MNKLPRHVHGHFHLTRVSLFACYTWWTNKKRFFEVCITNRKYTLFRQLLQGEKGVVLSQGHVHDAFTDSVPLALVQQVDLRSCQGDAIARELLRPVFTSNASICTSNIRRRINLWLISVFCPSKRFCDEDATEFAYVASVYSCVASENQALGPTWGCFSLFWRCT